MTPSPFLVSKVFTKEELCLFEKIPKPCGVVVFGASGDLAHRKLFPALFYLSEQNLLPKNFYILGFARSRMSPDAFRQKIEEALPSTAAPEKKAFFLERCHYVSGPYDQKKSYELLSARLDELDKTYNVPRRRVFYLSTPPEVYEPVVVNLGAAGLSGFSEAGGGCSAVIIEKPIGRSEDTARRLGQKIRSVFHEHQIYRIDHYLGKETVQNILMFRFANIIFEPVWNRRYVDHVQISATEELGVEHRAGYYDSAGVLRDMFQNHLLQLMALTAMEPPTSLDADAVRDKKIDVIRSLKPIRARDVKDLSVCAQYGPGMIGGARVPGYAQEPGVAPSSRTATFAAVRFELENWRWEGVPFYIRAGKRLAKRGVEISIHFKHVPISIFKPLMAEQLAENVLRFRIQPNEAITMSFEAKHPGPKLCMSTVTMDFGYQDSFGIAPPDSYARLFLDAMLGDQTLFARSDAVVESWRVIDPIIEAWEKPGATLPTYAAGSNGPAEADALITKDNRSWD